MTLSPYNPIFDTWSDWLMVLAEKKLLQVFKYERNNFTSTVMTDPYFYYAAKFFLDFKLIRNEIACLDLTYLMEQRLRYTNIRDEIELSYVADKLRRNCGLCLAKDKQDNDPENIEETIQETDEKKNSKKDTKRRSVTESKAQKELIRSKSQKMMYSGKSAKKDSRKVFSEKETESEGTEQEALNRQQKPMEKKKAKNLEVLKRFWFKREPSPPPNSKLDKCLDEVRKRVRKEIHTIVFLNSCALERKIELMRKYAEMFEGKSWEEWNKVIDDLETEYDPLIEPTEYNSNELTERLKKNPELIEALDDIKPDRITPQIIMHESFEIATRIEKQFFSLIPGVPGLTTYRNLMICEIAKDDAAPIILE